MNKETYQFTYEAYNSINDLSEQDAALLKAAREATKRAYAPYSHFHVGAVAKLENGQTVVGSNQENASFPVGLCAERVLLSAITALHPEVSIDTIAISYNSEHIASDHPVAPCGICRQSLQEMEGRLHHPIRLILGGMEGKVVVIPTASSLLPFAFSGDELG
jgi:cytidine deaminase